METMSTPKSLEDIMSSMTLLRGGDIVLLFPEKLSGLYGDELCITVNLSSGSISRVSSAGSVFARVQSEILPVVGEDMTKLIAQVLAVADNTVLAQRIMDVSVAQETY